MRVLYSLGDVYAFLPIEDAEKLKDYVLQNGVEKAVDLWLENIPVTELPVVPFAGTIGDCDDITFAERFRNEFDMFICGHPKYKKDRELLISNGSPITIAIASSIALVLAKVLCVSAAIITPVVLLLIRLVGEMTVNAYCNNKKSCED